MMEMNLGSPLLDAVLPEMSHLHESPDDSLSSAQRRTDEFARLYGQHARRIYAFILSLLPNWADAEEVFQETTTILWQKLDDFEPGTNFMAWACQVARYRVLHFRERSERQAVTFGDEFTELVDREIAEQRPALDDRHVALDECVQRLGERDRLMVRQYYHGGKTVAQVADEIDRGVDAVYKALQRIHRTLFECVDRKLREDRQ